MVCARHLGIVLVVLVLFVVIPKVHAEAGWFPLTFGGLSMKVPMKMEKLEIDSDTIAKMEAVEGVEIYQGTIGGLLVVAEVYQYREGLHADAGLAMTKAVERFAGNAKAAVPEYTPQAVTLGGLPGLRMDGVLEMTNPETGTPLPAPMHVVVVSTGNRVAQVMVLQVESEEVDKIRARKILESIAMKKVGAPAAKGEVQIVDGEAYEPFTVAGLTVKTPLQFVETPQTERTFDDSGADQVSFDSFQAAGSGLQMVVVVTKYRRDGQTDIDQKCGFVLNSLCQAMDLPVPEYTVDKVRLGDFEAREVHANLAIPASKGGTGEPMPVTLVLARSERTLARIVLLQTKPGEVYARQIERIIKGMTIAKKEFASADVGEKKAETAATPKAKGKK
ncbi:hypothetical protein BH09VER1_BH09VER1_43380 [soil metagenome]